MKNEDKIVELLSESLMRQDRQEEILNKQTKLLETLVDQFHKMNDHLLTRQDKIEDRVARLEDKVFKG